MSSFGEDSRSIDSVSDYTRRILTQDELQDATLCKPLLNWWKEKNAEKQRLPARKDFNPAHFKNILPNVTIFNMVFSDEKLVDMVPTLIGTELTRVYGEMTGKPFSEHESVYVYQGVLAGTRECLQRAAPIGVEAKAISENMPFMSSFALYCPLATDHIHIDKMLCQISFESNDE